MIETNSTIQKWSVAENTLDNRIIRFNYRRGSNPHSRRVVLVQRINRHTGGNINISGYDFEREAYREFKLSMMSNVQILEKSDDIYKIVDLSQLPDNVNKTENSYSLKIERRFNTEGYTTYVKDEVLYAVKVNKALPITEPYFIVKCPTLTPHSLIIVKHDDNDAVSEFIIKPLSDQTGVNLTIPRRTIVNITPQTLLEELTKFLS